MFDRFKKLLGAAASKGMDKLETPEILAEKALNELESDVKKISDGVAASLANEKNLEKKLKTNAEQIELWQKRAAVAVQNNNEQIARECLVKKSEAAQLDQELQTQLRQQQETTKQLKERYRETQEKLREVRTQQQNINARSRAADAMISAQEVSSGAGTGGTDQWEEKIRMKEALGEAGRQMAAESKTEDALGQASIEDELAALKRNQPPKLIEGPPDENKSS